MCPARRIACATLGCVAATTSGLPVCLAERRGVARKRLDVVAGAGHRHADQERIGRRIFGDHRQDVAEQRGCSTAAPR